MAENSGVKGVKGLARTIALVCTVDLGVDSFALLDTGVRNCESQQVRSWRRRHDCRTLVHRKKLAQASNSLWRSGTSKEASSNSGYLGRGVTLCAWTLSWSREPQCNGLGDYKPGNPERNWIVKTSRRRTLEGSVADLKGEQVRQEKAQQKRLPEAGQRTTCH
eukprot:4912471-Amphidinium_carterae.3